MFVSIVIPARNEEHYLPDCLRSLRDQAYHGGYEIVVADNGSTDNTAAIAREYGARVVYSDTLTSVFYAREVGADAASGDIIIQADADTVYPDNWLRRIVTQLEEHPEVSAISGRFLYREKFTWAFIELNVRHAVNSLHSFFFRRPLMIAGASFAFRRDTFLKAGGYRGLTYSADQYGIAERLRRYGPIIYDPKLCVSTSARSVRYSNLTLTLRLCGHIYHLLEHWIIRLFPRLPNSRTKKPRKAFTWELPPG